MSEWEFNGVPLSEGTHWPLDNADFGNGDWSGPFIEQTGLLLSEVICDRCGQPVTVCRFYPDETSPTEDGGYIVHSSKQVNHPCGCEAGTTVHPIEEPCLFSLTWEGDEVYRCQLAAGHPGEHHDPTRLAWFGSVDLRPAALPRPDPNPFPRIRLFRWRRR